MGELPNESSDRTIYNFVTVGWTIGNQALVAEGLTDAAADTAAMLIPYVPAGSTKIARIAASEAKAVEVATKIAERVANPVSETLARVVPRHIKPATLGKVDDLDVFVTNASELRGLSAKRIAEKLSIPESSSFRVIEFPSGSVQGIASPIGRANPGFVGAGRTAGGASEFVIPNGPIPAGAVDRIVH